jgi:hypothetical protein
MVGRRPGRLTATRQIGKGEAVPLFNVRLPVVALVGAGGPEEAILAFRQKLEAAGFDVYDGEPADAFESEPQEEE